MIISELEVLSGLAEKLGRKADILLRIIPGVEAHTHTYIQTGQLDSKFGISIAHNQAVDAVKKAAAAPNLNLRGLHCHIGSQIFELESYAKTVEVMVGLMAEAAKLGIRLSELDLGGGLGIKYVPEDHPASVQALGDLLTESLADACGSHGIPMPKVMVEPGRSLVGDAGVTVYRVGSIKKISVVAPMQQLMAAWAIIPESHCIRLSTTQWWSTRLIRSRRNSIRLWENTVNPAMS